MISAEMGSNGDSGHVAPAQSPAITRFRRIPNEYRVTYPELLSKPSPPRERGGLCIYASLSLAAER